LFIFGQIWISIGLSVFGFAANEYKQRVIQLHLTICNIQSTIWLAIMKVILNYLPLPIFESVLKQNTSQSSSLWVSLMVLLASAWLAWDKLASDKQSSLFGEEKKFYNVDARWASRNGLSLMMTKLLMITFKYSLTRK